MLEDSPRWLTYFLASCGQIMHGTDARWAAGRFQRDFRNKLFHVFYPRNLASSRTHKQSWIFYETVINFFFATYQRPLASTLWSLCMYFSDMSYKIMSRFVDGFRSSHIELVYGVSWKSAMVSLKYIQKTTQIGYYIICFFCAKMHFWSKFGNPNLNRRCLKWGKSLFYVKFDLEGQGQSTPKNYGS